MRSRQDPSVPFANAIALLDAIGVAVERVNGRGSQPRVPDLDQRVWYDDQGNLLTCDAGGVERYVMVEFERPLMEKTAEILCRGGGHVLNVGFGCGIVDSAIARHGVASHTIVEGHPVVFRHMLEAGWGERPSVALVNERWENVDWWNYEARFDAIFFDPYPFDVVEFEQVYWRECVLKILKPKTGVLVLYGPKLDLEGAKAIAASFRRPLSLEPTETCAVEVPFSIVEWNEFGVGTHNVPVFTLRAS